MRRRERRLFGLKYFFNHGYYPIKRGPWKIYWGDQKLDLSDCEINFDM